MKALVAKDYGQPPSNLEVTEVPDPTPSPGQHWMRDREGPEDEATRRAVGEVLELGADVGRRALVEEAGVAQLLNARVDKRAAEKEPNRPINA